jgi:hypothetical protein
MSTEAECQRAAASVDRESSKGALLITPLALSTIEDRTCPICREPYIEMPTTEQSVASEDGEWPVSVDMVAEWFGPKRCCGHIMGRLCLQKHLKTVGEWSNTCPICRDIWFHRYVPENVSESGEVLDQDETTSREGEPVRRSQRLAAQGGKVREVNAGSRMSQRNGVGQHQSDKRRRLRPARFAARLLAALEVEDGSDGIKGTLEEVQEKLDKLYRGLQE